MTNKQEASQKLLILQKTLKISSQLLIAESLEEMIMLNSSLTMLGIASNMNNTEAQRLISASVKLSSISSKE